MPHSWQLTWWIPFSVEQIYLPLIIYFAIWKCLKLFIVTTDVSIFLQLIIIINALFIFIFIIFVTINTIIVMLIFTFKVYFLNFSCVPLVCVNLPDRFFLKDYNRNKVFFMLSLQLYLIYDLFDIIFNFDYTIILEKLLKFLFLGTIFWYSLLLTDLLTNVKHHRKFSFNNVWSLRKYVARGAP